MQNRKVSQQIQRLQNLFSKTSDACGNNPELQSEWAKYLCVLSAGFIERALQEIIIEYANSKVSKPAARFIIIRISKVKNPKCSTILEVLGAFKESWRNDVNEYLEVDGRRDAIDTLMDNRHKIAHGQSERSGAITRVRVEEYFKKAVKVLEEIEKKCTE